MKSLLATGLLGLIVLTLLIPPPLDKVVFLDVGQGDAILIQKGTQQVLIDGGPGMTVLRRLGEELPWFDRTIEVVILTHPQQDHVEGLVHVLERYKVGLVLFPQAAYGSQLASTWLQELIDRSIPYRFAWAGQELQLDGVRFSVLAPFADAEGQALVKKSINNASTTTRIDFPAVGGAGALSFLMTGDAEAGAEKLLVERYKGSGTLNLEFLTPLDVDVLKAGHHGSKTSTTPELLAAASPSAVVVSVGADNRYGHPHPTAMERLKDFQVWRTDEDGSVRFRHYGGNWLISNSLNKLQ